MNNYFENEKYLVPFSKVTYLYFNNPTGLVVQFEDEANYISIEDATARDNFVEAYKAWLKFESLKANVRLDAMMPSSTPIIR